MSRTRMVPLRFPEDLLKSIDELVGTGGRTRFIVEAAAQELARRRQRQALESTVGTWRREDHPELPDTLEGTAAAIREARRRAERRTR